MDPIFKLQATQEEEWPRCRWCGQAVYFDIHGVKCNRAGGQSHQCQGERQEGHLAVVRRIQARYGEES